MMKTLQSKDFLEEGKAIKKPIAISFMILDEEVEVKTLEGTLKGKKGDYIIKGIQGEIYPVDREIFESTYNISPQDFSCLWKKYVSVKIVENSLEEIYLDEKPIFFLSPLKVVHRLENSELFGCSKEEICPRDLIIFQGETYKVHIVESQISEGIFRFKAEKEWNDEMV